MGFSRLRQEEHAEDIGLKRPLELFLGDVADVFVGMLLAGIVDEDVETAELVHDLLHRAFAKCLVAEIAGNGDRFPPFPFDNLLRLRRIVVLAQVKDGDVGTLAGVQGGDRPADSAVGPSDESDLSL
jgi:hypothetical protein